MNTFALKGQKSTSTLLLSVHLSDLLFILTLIPLFNTLTPTLSIKFSLIYNEFAPILTGCCVPVLPSMARIVNLLAACGLSIYSLTVELS